MTTLNALVLEIDYESWQEIFTNGGPVYKEDFGQIVALFYFFEGTGAFDYVKLTRPDGELVF